MATFETSEQPDELIQLAWSGGYDKKAVIREGIDAAALLLAGERNDLATLFIPRPRPLEVVNRWAENPRSATEITEGLRPFASAVLPGCLVGYIVGRALNVHGVIPMIAIVVGAFVIIGSACKVLIDASLRRRVAALDEASALAIVLEQLRRGMIVNAALVPRAVVWIRRGLAQP